MSDPVMKVRLSLELATTREKQPVTLAVNETVQSLLDEAAEFAGLSPAQISLIANRRVLSEMDRSIEDCQLEDGTTVFIIINTVQLISEGDSKVSSSSEESSDLSCIARMAVDSADIAPDLSSKTSMDLCILVQSTSSMQSWVTQLRSDISRVVAQMHRDYGTQVSPLNLALVAYRDFDDSEDAPKRVEVFDFFECDPDNPTVKFEELLNSLECRGGVDVCEDVLGGLHACATQLRWSSDIRLLYHISHSPAHGTKFHDLFAYACDGDASEEEDQSEESEHLSDADYFFIEAEDLEEDEDGGGDDHHRREEKKESESESGGTTNVLTRDDLDRFPDGHTQDESIERIVSMLKQECKVNVYALAKKNEYVTKMIRVFSDVCDHFGLRLVILDIPNLNTLLPTLLSAVQTGIRLVRGKGSALDAGGSSEIGADSFGFDHSSHLGSLLDFRSQKHPFKMIVGVDFGTSGVGISYAMAKNDRSSMMDVEDEKDESKKSEQKAIELLDLSQVSTEHWECDDKDRKTGTHLLLVVCDVTDEHPDGLKLEAFGTEARLKYENLEFIEEDSDSEDDEDDSSKSDEEEEAGSSLASGLPGEMKEVRSMRADPKNWLFFERFKMALYAADSSHESNEDEKKSERDGRVDIQDEVTAANGVSVRSSVILREALRYVCERALKGAQTEYDRRMADEATVVIESEDGKLDESRTLLTNRDVQWVLTVPAIWSARAKSIMERAALESGMINKDVFRHLLIAYEPDCASVSVAAQTTAQLREKIRNAISKGGSGSSDWRKLHPFAKSGAKYLLLDLGGGTADVACHEVVGLTGVREIYRPTGGPWGSTMIDRAFESWLIATFGRAWITQFQQECPQAWLKILDAFSQAKSTFGKAKPRPPPPASASAASSSSAKSVKKGPRYHGFTIGQEFVGFVEMKLSESDSVKESWMKECSTFDELWKSYAFTPDSPKLASMEVGTAVRVNPEDTAMLDLCYPLWAWLFDSVVNPICHHCEWLLNEVTRTQGESTSSVSDFKYVILVGGLSESEYLRHRITKCIGSRSKWKLRVFPSTEPSLAVVKGASLVGLNPSYIQCRSMAKTYGIAVEMELEEFLQSDGALAYEIDSLEQIPDHLIRKVVSDSPSSSSSSSSATVMISEVFMTIVRKGEIIRSDEDAKVLYFSPAGSSGKIVVRLYHSDEDQPLWAKKRDLVAQKTFVISQQLMNATSQSRGSKKAFEFPIGFLFGETTIQVYVCLPGLDLSSRIIHLDYDRVK